MLLSIFAFEVCQPMATSNHEYLRRLLSDPPETTSVGDKWSFYQSVFQAISANVPQLTHGCWDYFDDDKRARHDFDNWAETLHTHGGVRQEESTDDEGPYRVQTLYTTLTAAFLIKRDTDCDQALRSLTEIPESQLWKRASFARIFAGLGALNFASIKSDVVYLIPRDTGLGLTLEDLSKPDFDYLRPIED